VWMDDFFGQTVAGTTEREGVPGHHAHSGPRNLRTGPRGPRVAAAREKRPAFPGPTHAPNLKDTTKKQIWIIFFNRSPSSSPFVCPSLEDQHNSRAGWRYTKMLRI